MNDGNTILHEIDVANPAAKNMLKLSRTQDEECGNGTTSVIILAGEILAHSIFLLTHDIHPVIIISAYSSALAAALATIESISILIDMSSDSKMLTLIKTSIGTKFVKRWSELMCNLSLQAICIVTQDTGPGGAPLSTSNAMPSWKKYPVERSRTQESQVLNGVPFNEDITHPQIQRHIINPHILLL